MTENVEVVKLDTQEAQTSVKELRQQLKSLKDEMAGLEEGSDAFLECANKAGTLKHQLDEINESISGASADFGDMLSNATKATTGIIGGFQAAKGALTLFGVESEEVTKAIQKMQASMAIIQGMDSIDKGIKALAKLRNAITATTGAAKVLRAALTPKSILALTVAVTAIIGVWNKFGDSIENALPFITKIKDAFNDTADAADKAKQKQEEYLDAAKDAETKLKEFRTQEKVAKLNKEAKKQYDELTNAIKGYTLEWENAQAQANKHRDNRELYNKYIAEGVAWRNKQAKALGEITALLDNEANYIEKVVVEKEKKIKVDKEEKAVKDTFFDDAYAELEYNKAINKSYADSKVALEDLLYIQQQELATLTEGTAAWYKLATTIEETKQNIIDFGKTDEETVTEESIEPEEEEKHPLLLELYSVQDALADLASDDSWGIIMKNMGNLAVKMADVGKQIKQNGKQDWTAYAQIAAAALNTIGTALIQLGSQEEATTKESFERKKKLEISGAVLNMLGGIVSAISSAMNPANAWMTAPGQIAMATVMSGLVAAVGGIQIAKIAKQELSGSTTTGETDSANVSSSAVSSTLMPPVQYSNAIQGVETEEAISNSRYYVSVTEIDRVQERVNVAETESQY